MFEHLDILPTWDKTHEAWLEERAKGIGGSDIGTIVGLNPYASQYSLWHERMGYTPPFEGNEATNLGNLFEAPIAFAYAKKFNVAIVVWPVLLRSKQAPWQSANLDGLIVTPSDEFPAGTVTEYRELTPPEGIEAVFEVKTTGLATPGKAGDWFIDGESVPLTYTCQGLWYLHITGLDRVDYGVLLPGQGILKRSVYYDQDLANELVAEAYEFWQRIENNDPPEPTGIDADEEAQKARWERHVEGKTIDGGETIAQIWDEFEALKAIEKDAIAQRKAARAKLADLIGDAEAVYWGDTPIFTFKNNADTTWFDEKSLEKDYPEIHAVYRKKKAGARVMRGVK